MNRYNEGSIVYHKATGYRCVIIRQNENATIKVRTEKDEEKDYYPQELKTEEEIQNENRSFIADFPQDDPYGY